MLSWFKSFSKPVTHETKLSEFLGSDAIGTYVNKGTYGFGLNYKFESDRPSPFSYRPLGSSAESSNCKSVFIKLVPLTDAKSRDFKKIKKKQSNCMIYVDKGSVIWKLNDTESSSVFSFIKEVESQSELYEKTTVDSPSFTTSFVLPVYENIIVDKNNNLQLINVLKKKFNGDSSLFTNIKNALKLSKHFKLGIIVMPMMPIPPMEIGWIALRNLNLYNKDYASLNMETISIKSTDYLLHDYDDSSITYEQKKGIFILTQIVHHMIRIFELGLERRVGMVHGDVHPGNILIDPKLPNTTQCFEGDVLDEDSPYLSTVFLIDFGTVVKRDVEITETDPFKRFKIIIKKIMTISGSHSHSPLSHYVFDWFPALFLKRDKKQNYVLINDHDNILKLNHNNILELDHDTYFIEKNFKVMFDMINKFKYGNDNYIGVYTKENKSSITGGNDGKMSLMKDNLKNGEKCLQMLKAQYPDRHGIGKETVKKRIPKSSSLLVIKKRKTRKNEEL